MLVIIFDKLIVGIYLIKNVPFSPLKNDSAFGVRNILSMILKRASAFKNKSKVARNGKKGFGFSYSKNMANFEAAFL